jgi:hypothetical protein
MASSSIAFTANPNSAVRGPVNYALSTGSATPIPATRFANRVEIQEPSGSSQGGIQINYNDGTSAKYLPADYPVILEFARNQIRGSGHFLAMPAQVGAAAQNYCTITALAAGTSVEVLELP